MGLKSFKDIRVDLKVSCENTERVFETYEDKKKCYVKHWI